MRIWVNEAGEKCVDLFGPNFYNLLRCVQEDPESVYDSEKMYWRIPDRVLTSKRFKDLSDDSISQAALSDAEYMRLYESGQAVFFDLETYNVDWGKIPDINGEEPPKDLVIPKEQCISCIGYKEFGKPAGLFFAETPSDEGRMLRDFLKMLNGRPVITYNGIRFDMVVLATRCDFHGIVGYPTSCLDLIIKTAILKRQGLIERGRLIDVEKLYGFTRDSFDPGWQMPGYYKQWVETRDKSAREKMETHVLDDVTHVADDIMPILIKVEEDAVRLELVGQWLREKAELAKKEREVKEIGRIILDHAKSIGGVTKFTSDSGTVVVDVRTTYSLEHKEDAKKLIGVEGVEFVPTKKSIGKMHEKIEEMGIPLIKETSPFLRTEREVATGADPLVLDQEADLS